MMERIGCSVFWQIAETLLREPVGAEERKRTSSTPSAEGLNIGSHSSFSTACYAASWKMIPTV